jgi:hypothetical protein
VVEDREGEKAVWLEREQVRQGEEKSQMSDEPGRPQTRV